MLFLNALMGNLRAREARVARKTLPIASRCGMSTHPQEKWNVMSFLHGNSFADRQAAAAKAKKAMAEKFLAKSKYDPNDPGVKEREAKRKAILEVRAVREAERARRRAEEAAAEAALKAVDEAARQERLRLQALAREAEAERLREEQERLDYEKKLERDARYAARKERKKKKKSVAERWG
jgi:Family of unknown function (DUF6481)